MCEVNPKELTATLTRIIDSKLDEANAKAEARDEKRDAKADQRHDKVWSKLNEVSERTATLEGTFLAGSQFKSVSGPQITPSPWAQHIGKIITGIIFLFALLIYLIAGQVGVTLPTNIPGVG